MSELVANPKCSVCKCYFIPAPNPRSNMLYKSCEKCRTRDKNHRDKNKCEHNKRRRYCKDCGGSQICEHNRQRSACKDCGGSQICEHDRQRSYCIDCGGSRICEHNRRKGVCKECAIDTPALLTIIAKKFTYDSKNKDKKYNRFDIVNFIDTDFCKLLIEESNYKCCYCECELELIHYGSNLITIERINNSIGHIKSNVKIACFKCNVSKVGDKLI